MSEQWAAVDAYIDERLVHADAALRHVAEASAAAGLPPIAVSASQGKLLAILATSVGAKRILEIGTLGGFSGIWLARALPEGGRLVTIELEVKHADVARQSFIRAGVEAVVDLRVGPALEVLPQIEREGASPFDLVFIDADKGHYPEYLDWAVRLSRPGTLIVADNVVRDGEVIDAASDDQSILGIRRFMERAGAHPRLTATAIQTVGVKGYDGLAVILVGR